MSCSKVKTGVKTGIRCSDDTVYDGILGTYLRSCNHPEAPYLLNLLQVKDYAGLLGWTARPVPQMYGDAASYLADVQIVSLIKKYPFNDQEIPGLNPELEAVRKFAASEHRCKRVNQRYRARRALRRFENTNQFFWSRARAYIASVIGDKPDISTILGLCDFTAGASMGVNGNKTSFIRKIFADSWTVTPSALPYARVALWKNIHARDCILPGAIKCYDYEKFVEIVDSKSKRVACNKIAFVPKTAKTHRSIAVEPLLNGFIQKGIDVFMRRKLRRVNIDLENQTPNQVLAYAGSVQASNPYCTIDLASASDSLSVEVVRDLLPPDWFEFLMDIRAPAYEHGGVTSHYEKFCSMGNGFCFPLQTLIFASVCHSSLQETGGDTSNFAVYGDDIVVPQNEALLVLERLRDIGFSANADKTFVTGCFRESCGRDWFSGRDVRPVTLDKRMTDIRQLCAFHNSTLRSDASTFAFGEVREYLRSFRPQLLRPGVEPGDTCFSVPLDLAMTSPWVRWSKAKQNWTWVEIISKPVVDPAPYTVVERENALEYAVLRGSDSRRPFTLRYTTKARRRIVSRPYWTRIRSPFGYGGIIFLDLSFVVCCRAGFQ